MILITGANGQLGTELRHLLDEYNQEYIAVDVVEMDITNAEMVGKVFAQVKPSIVYHCAAYTAVDAAEDKLTPTETSEEPAPTEEAMAEADEDSLSISLPRSLFTETALQNLDALLLSKGRLIRHAFDIREATYTLTDDRITFAWLHGTITDETAKAYAAFISKLCEMARTQKRVTAKEKIVDNEKYAFRCFLLRLGMIGSAYKESRKILLQNLTGSSAFKSGHRKEAEHHAVSE